MTDEQNPFNCEAYFYGKKGTYMLTQDDKSPTEYLLWFTANDEPMVLMEVITNKLSTPWSVAAAYVSFNERR